MTKEELAATLDGREYLEEAVKEEVTFESLIGEHVLEGVDMFDTQVESWEGGPMESANAMRFMLDGKIYVAVEDPEDGYRSCMKSLTVDTEPIKNSFAGVRVLVRQAPSQEFSNDDILEMIDLANGKVVLSVGTRNTEDYYPFFEASWTPENLAVNAKLEADHA